MAMKQITELLKEQSNLRHLLGNNQTLIADFQRKRVKLHRETSGQLARIDKEYNASFVSNFGSATKSLMSLGRKASSSLSKHLGTALYDLGTGTKSVKESFSDMAQSFTRDILKMTSRMIALKLVQGTLGSIGMGGGMTAFARGGIMPGHFIPVTPMAVGGIFSRPTMGLVAEGKNAEAVVPLPNNRSIPVEMRGAREQRPVTVVNVLDQSMIEGVVSDTLAKKSQVILNMVGNDIRQGGATYQAMKGVY